MQKASPELPAHAQVSEQAAGWKPSPPKKTPWCQTCALVVTHTRYIPASLHPEALPGYTT